MVEMLLRYRADATLQDIYGETVWHMASYAASEQVLLKLIRSNKRVHGINIKNKAEETPLDLAVKMGSQTHSSSLFQPNQAAYRPVILLLTQNGGRMELSSLTIQSLMKVMHHAGTENTRLHVAVQCKCLVLDSEFCSFT